MLPVQPAATIGDTRDWGVVTARDQFVALVRCHGGVEPAFSPFRQACARQALMTSGVR